ncbi:uncharacterized protein [Rutidosis leptorrhynchoides]|uniref:uncharacterized protein n=1 Tax=Rutidosis leptorrhynchoides TaxID=125765 RepID=UPI003A9A199D
MVFQRIISRFPGYRSGISGRSFNPSVKFSDEPLSKITQKRDLFSGSFETNGPSTHVLRNAMPSFLKKVGFPHANSVCSSLKFASSIHTVGPKEFEKGLGNGPADTEKNTGFFDGPNTRLDEMNRRQPLFETGRNPGYFESLSRRMFDSDRSLAPAETGRDVRPFSRGFGSIENSRNSNFVRGIMRDNNNNMNDNYRSGLEQNADIVHIKILRNNTFVTVTDSKGNKKTGSSAGSLAEMKGGPKVSRYSADATAEHVGRVAKSMGLKSVVVKVNGFTYFKKKKTAIQSFRDGYTNSRSDKNPIVYIEDTTRKPHNGCRLRKQRRI